MTDDRLITQLVADLTPTSALRPRQWWQTQLYYGIGVLLLILATLGLREDLHQAWSSGALIWKPGLFALWAIGGSFLAIELSRPEGTFKGMHGLAFALGALLLLCECITQSYSSGLTPQLPALAHNGAWTCPAIILVGGLIAMSLLWRMWLRRTASPTPSALGFLVGLVSGSTVAASYALHCDQDGWLYITCYYITPILLLAIGGALWGRRALRW